MNNRKTQKRKKAKRARACLAYFVDDSIGSALMRFGNWGTWRKTNNPNGVVALRLTPDATPLGLKTIRRGTQGSSFLATLGCKTQSPWDCRTVDVPSVPPKFPFDRSFQTV
jgi:hypothetical protein